MRTVRGVAGQALLLALVAWTVGLGPVGWAAGLLYGVALNVLVMRALDGAPLGPAGRVTLLRATLVGAALALVVDTSVRPAQVGALVALSALALVLDGVDGRVARRTRSSSAFGARFDMETDAFLILVLSGYVAATVAPWVIAIGLARYVYGAAGRFWPALRRPVPPRFWRKVVAATEGVVLTVASSGLLPQAFVVAALAGALVLLAESFGRDIWWQVGVSRRVASGRLVHAVR